MIQLTHACVSYPTGNLMSRMKAALLTAKTGSGTLHALQDITLWIGRGESWAVCGEENAGKTSLLRLLSGRMPAKSGKVEVHGRALAAFSSEEGFFAHETGSGNARLIYLSEQLDETAMHIALEKA